MSLDLQKLQARLQNHKELEAKRLKYRKEVEEVEERCNQLARARARAETDQGHSVSQNIPQDFNADRESSPSQESCDASDDNSEYSIYPVPPPSVAESPSPTPAAPSEENLRRFATTVAYSSYSRLCGTSDDSLIQHLFEDEPAAIIRPKKMVEVPQGEHNIAYLRQEIVEGAATPFATSMAEARRRMDPETTTADQVRRLGPAEILDDSLPIYWIVTVSQQGVLDWEGGCSLARAYRRVLEEFGADDVHCLVFECEIDFSAGEGQKAYAME